MANLIEFDTEYELKHMGMEIPAHTQETIENYLMHGWKPGGFVESLLAKDYERAITIADTANRQRFWSIATWIKDWAPENSRGSYDAVNNWCNDTDGIRTKFVNETEKKFIWKVLKE